MYLIVVRLRFNSPASVTITYSFQAGDRSFACRGDGGITGCVCVCVWNEGVIGHSQYIFSTQLFIQNY